MAELQSIVEHETETALMVGVVREKGLEKEVEDSLSELAALCRTAGAEIAGTMVCRMDRPHPGTFIGQGKAVEIAEQVKVNRISSVVFDDDLSPAQGRNLERIIGTKVVDRTQVILDIFAQHARTSEGRMQIELAQLEYLLPRLRRMWTHLERQKGGIGLRGPGEKQLEMDRRSIVESISRFQTRLEQVRKRRAEQRRGRRRHGWALVSLVGYTNAGKSTLINALTDAGVLAYDKLFATLDPTTRQLKLPNHQQVLLTDTVGFIRKLPHDLVESFKATLEEVAEADLLVHVIDASHPLVEQQIEAVESVLKEIGVRNVPVISVLNKCDRAEASGQAARLKQALSPAVMLSAKTGEGLEAFRSLLADELRSRNHRVHLTVPIAEGKVIAALKSSASIYEIVYDHDFVRVDAAVPEALLGMCSRYMERKKSDDDDGNM